MYVLFCWSYRIDYFNVPNTQTKVVPKLLKPIVEYFSKCNFRFRKLRRL